MALPAKLKEAFDLYGRKERDMGGALVMDDEAWLDETEAAMKVAGADLANTIEDLIWALKTLHGATDGLGSLYCPACDIKPLAAGHADDCRLHKILNAVYGF